MEKFLRILDVTLAWIGYCSWPIGDDMKPCTKWDKRLNQLISGSEDVQYVETYGLIRQLRFKCNGRLYSVDVDRRYVGWGNLISIDSYLLGKNEHRVPLPSTKRKLKKLVRKEKKEKMEGTIARFSD